MRILVDPNIVARMSQLAHTDHAAAVGAVQALLLRGDDLFMIPQVAYEFWVVATRPVLVNGLNLMAAEADAALAAAEAVFTLLRDERAVLSHWRRLVLQHDVKGKSAHDARLVAAMQRHNLTHILTFNGPDFARYPGISVLPPSAVSTT